MDKWLGIAITCMFIGLGSSIAITEWSKGKCKMAAIEKGMPAVDITRICG